MMAGLVPAIVVLGKAIAVNTKCFGRQSSTPAPHDFDADARFYSSRYFSAGHLIRRRACFSSGVCGGAATLLP
jgi:hypothetical protein